MAQALLCGLREIFTGEDHVPPLIINVLSEYRWLWSPDRYVAIKINAAGRLGRQNLENELQISKLISKGNSSHHGRHFVRKLLDDFIIEGPYHQHTCLVFEPLREPLWLTRTRFGTNTIPSEILKVVVQMLLHGLDYLHTSCHVIHTGKSLISVKLFKDILIFRRFKT